MTLNWLFYSNRTSRLREYFKKCDEYGFKERKVSKPCPTRWNYMYESLVVSYKYRNPITATYNARIGSGGDDDDDDDHLSNQDWLNVKMFVNFLEQFHVATTELSGQYYSTISNCLVYVSSLINLFIEYSDGGVIYQLAIDSMKAK